MTNRQTNILFFILFQFSFINFNTASNSLNIISTIDSFTIDMVTTSVSCYGGNDGVISAIPNGGTFPFQYNWSNGHELQTNSNLIAGNYSVTVTDLTGFQIIASIILEQPNEFSAEAIPNDGFCGENATMQVSTAGGTPPFNYEWSNGASTILIDNLLADNYTITVTDAEGCTAISSAAVEVDPTPLLFEAEASAPSCHEGSDGNIDIEITSGNPPYDISWSNGTTDLDNDNLEAGTYTFFVIDDHDCANGITVFLEDPEPLELDLESDGLNAYVIADGGTPPYSYEWSNGHDTQLNPNLEPDTYTVTVTDNNGCEESGWVDVLLPLSNHLISSIENIDIYPIPVKDYLNIDLTLNTSSSINFAIFDMNGKLLLTEISEGTNFSKSLDMSNLPEGMYLLLLSNEEGIYSKKVMVQR